MKIIHTFSKHLLARGCHGEIAGFQYFGLGEEEITAVGGVMPHRIRTIKIAKCSAEKCVN